MDKELLARLDKIESHLAHLEHQHEQLNQVVVAQAKVIAKLQGNQSRLSDTLESIELERVKSTSVKPPHYQ